MQRFIVVFLLLLAVAVGVGLYTGWFHIGLAGADRTVNVLPADPE
jgi:hypothetical protein